MSEPTSVPSADQAVEPLWSAWTSLEPLLKPLLSRLPGLAWAAGLALAGWLLARLARRATPKLMDKLGVEALAEKVGVSRALYSAGYHGGFGRLSGQLVYGLVLALTAQLVLEQLGLPALSELMQRALDMLPDLVASALIMGATLGLAELVERLLGASRDEQATDSGLRALAARGVKGVIVALGAVVALEQLGVQTAMISAVIQAAFAASALTAALGFGLGARHALGHLLAKHYARALLREGDLLHLDEGSGRLVRFDGFYAIILMPEGVERLIPCRELISKPLRFEAAVAETV